MFDANRAGSSHEPPAAISKNQNRTSLDSCDIRGFQSLRKPAGFHSSVTWKCCETESTNKRERQPHSQSVLKTAHFFFFFFLIWQDKTGTRSPGGKDVCRRYKKQRTAQFLLSHWEVLVDAAGWKQLNLKKKTTKLGKFNYNKVRFHADLGEPKCWTLKTSYFTNAAVALVCPHVKTDRKPSLFFIYFWCTKCIKRREKHKEGRQPWSTTRAFSWQARYGGTTCRKRSRWLWKIRTTFSQGDTCDVIIQGRTKVAWWDIKSVPPTLPTCWTTCSHFEKWTSPSNTKVYQCPKGPTGVSFWRVCGRMWSDRLFVLHCPAGRPVCELYCSPLVTRLMNFLICTSQQHRSINFVKKNKKKNYKRASVCFSALHLLLPTNWVQKRFVKMSI